jgi:sulfate transport system permease protein
VAAVITKGFGDGTGALRRALDVQGAWGAIRLTLEMAAVTAIVNGVFGTLLAYVLVRFPFPGRGLVGAIVDMPFAVPTLVTGVMLVSLYGPNAPVGGFLKDHGVDVIFAPLGILLALLFVTLPLVVRSVEPVLLELDYQEEEAAHTLGATGWTTFRRVVLPALRPAIAAGALLTFARALGEFGAIVIVAGNIPNKTLTAPVFIFQLTSQFRPEEAAAVATVLFVLSFTLVLVTERLVKRRSTAE